ncbi:MULTISPECIES: SigB/SigF/SigG family RNA polymerase sigma factor [unclassified Streptomyces]|uniref:SigB/SigF/SigG family RNA polymerase sigma factor n=1 Tax=unclassified Streptomyces TaxID=2593676 RepID=UPI0028C4FB48|nr:MULTISPECIES: SigB/SigF/SigG family RNA polymerase sigma factor [unclassified Streptomyces]WNO76182.1 SigB/SigF/SigG family RNA polymerase sigma factor [Streptomyces sp. AM8-1-1]
MSRTLAVPATVDLTEPGSVSTTDAKELSAALFERMATLDEGTAEYAYARNTLVELNLSLVKFAATRFRNRAEPMEDIIQVGTIGLIKAINRFDTGRGVEFACFALPTIVGEMKRFFRDTSWAVRVPRRLQELRIDLAKAVDVMEQDLGRRPTTAELAERLDVTEEEIVEGERASNGYVARSLDVPANEDDGTVGALTRSLGCEDRSYDIVDCLESLKPLIAALDERDRLVLSLRFGDELTQSEIGDRLGLSQMHVSRLLARILGALRAGLLSDEPPADGPTDPESPPAGPAT